MASILTDVYHIYDISNEHFLEKLQNKDTYSLLILILENNIKTLIE